MNLNNVLNELTNHSILIPYLVGPHGIGKTSFVKDWAKERNKSILILNLSAIESADLTGIPIVQETRTVWSRPNIFDYDILFLDEVNRVTDPSVKAALLSLFIDRSINGHQYKGIIIAAGNSGEDYEINDFDPALNDRLVRIEFTPDLKYVKNKQFRQFIEDNNLLERFSLRRLTEAEKFLNNLEIMRLILDPATITIWERFIEANKDLGLEELIQSDLSEIDKITLVNAILSHKGDFDERLTKFLAELSAEIWSLLMQKAIETQNEVFQKKLAQCLQNYPNLWSDEKRWVLLESLRQAITAA